MKTRILKIGNYKTCKDCGKLIRREYEKCNACLVKDKTAAIAREYGLVRHGEKIPSVSGYLKYCESVYH